MTTPQADRILLFGATGLIGKYITAAIVGAQPPFPRVGIFTSKHTVEAKKDEIAELKAKGVEVFVGDVGDVGVVKGALEGFTTVISALGRNALTQQSTLLRAAADSPNITRFFPSEYGTDVAYDASSAGEKTHQAKLAVRRAIEDEGAVREGRLQYTYLVTGPYPELFFAAPAGGEGRVGGFDRVGRRAWVVGDGAGGVAFTTMPDVGKFLVAALRNPDAARNRALRVHSFTSTPNDVVKEFERQTGEKWEVEFVPLAELERFEQEAWEKGDPLAALATLRRIWASGKTLYEGGWDDGALGVEVEGLEGTVRRVLRGE
ncbi:uncharacterized protein K452DRAFT_275921 [Aplosporella prunicola CBS 121167]|uniref:NmrA-like domain-containing protein n=1 Tax=Aplosporella prunicola CBS 121167 TaxID=1176127 RepID=A0A6A6B4N2_9PEZI|nr:uncharacterized protein K452DRAFT_275921 [Aplosporella prunicola CBS 121167]KAF2138990.1 hypothetical protein K452DRAFT_275921 [Aplosporella prunicola CBS 121167]